MPNKKKNKKDSKESTDNSSNEDKPQSYGTDINQMEIVKVPVLRVASEVQAEDECAKDDYPVHNAE